MVARPDGRAGFEALEHTADVGIHAWGPSPEEAFAQAVSGLVAIGGAAAGPGPTRTRTLVVRAADPEALLVDLLNEVILVLDTEGVGVAEVRVREGMLAGPEPAATADLRVGARSEAAEGIDVKAATFHRTGVVRRPDGATDVTVYLDV